MKVEDEEGNEIEPIEPTNEQTLDKQIDSQDNEEVKDVVKKPK